MDPSLDVPRRVFAVRVAIAEPIVKATFQV
jgi:hypothetical protein